MSFQSRLANLEPVETCATLESAAWERYWDGFDLATSSTAGRYTGALYLLGYVVEIVLKIVESGDAVLTMGARDPGLPVLARRILAELEQRSPAPRPEPDGGNPRST